MSEQKIDSHSSYPAVVDCYQKGLKSIEGLYDLLSEDKHRGSFADIQLSNQKKKPITHCITLQVADAEAGALLSKLIEKYRNDE